MTGAEVRTAYLNAGFSRRAFGREIDVPEQSIRRLEDGLPISPRYAKRIADFLGVTVMDLIEPNPDPNLPSAA